MPPITELTRIEPVLIERLDHQGIFTTGLLLEVSETPTRRQTLADQVKTDVTDVLEWRDEALMLNLASFGPDEHLMMIQARASRACATSSTSNSTPSGRRSSWPRASSTWTHRPT